MKKRRPVPLRTYAVNPFPKKEALLFPHPIRQSLKHTVIHQLYVIAGEMTSVFICIILYSIRIFMNFPPFNRDIIYRPPVMQTARKYTFFTPFSNKTRAHASMVLPVV